MTKKPEFNYVGMYKGCSCVMTSSGKTKLYHDWLILSEEPEKFNFLELDMSSIKDAKILTFGGNNLVSTSPGNIHKLARDLEGDAGWFKTSEFCGRFPIVEYRHQLYMEHIANKNAHAANQKKTKDMLENPIFDVLEPIRLLYRKSTHAKRVQILAYIINRITN